MTPKPNYFEGTKHEFYTFLINQFSLPTATILDMTNDKGTIFIVLHDVTYSIFTGALSQASLQNGRNAICAVESLLSETIANLSAKQ